jgi:hypothetical protein
MYICTSIHTYIHSPYSLLVLPLPPALTPTPCSLASRYLRQISLTTCLIFPSYPLPALPRHQLDTQHFTSSYLGNPATVLPFASFRHVINHHRIDEGVLLRCHSHSLKPRLSAAGIFGNRSWSAHRHPAGPPLPTPPSPSSQHHPILLPFTLQRPLHKYSLAR